MKEEISVIIPAHNEQNYIARCLESVRVAEQRLSRPVEIIVVANRCTDHTEAIARRYSATVVTEHARNLAKIRNAGIKASTGRIVVTIDADSWMSGNMLQEVSRRLAGGRYVGGGVLILPERLSLGILFSTMTFAPQLILDRSWAGMFWALRRTVDAVGGFNEALVSVEDVDFARRLKAFGHANGLRYGLILRAYMVTSCRKFDQFGDWYFFRNRQFVNRLLSGRDREAADCFYYDVRQDERTTRSQPD